MSWIGSACITAFIPPFEREDRVYQGTAGEGVAVDAEGNVYVSDMMANRIYTVADGAVSVQDGAAQRALGEVAREPPQVALPVEDLVQPGLEEQDGEEARGEHLREPRGEQGRVEGRHGRGRL